MKRRMLRYQVLVNDRPQTLSLSGAPRHVAAARLGVSPEQQVVEFWAEGYTEPDEAAERRTFQVFGTGHQLPDCAVWYGTTDRTPEGLVWHLFEVPEETPS